MNEFREGGGKEREREKGVQEQENEGALSESTKFEA